MYQHILLSTDGSELAQRGIDHGLGLAKSLGSKVTIITVTEPFPTRAKSAEGWVFGSDDVKRYDTGEKELAGRILSSARAGAAEMGIEANVLHIPQRLAADAIVETAERIAADLIVMASHGRRGISRLLLGSQTMEVLAHSSVPVLVVR
jgi:nucleotide-binding universal stress UspA family protein